MYSEQWRILPAQLVITDMEDSSLLLEHRCKRFTLKRLSSLTVLHVSAETTYDAIMIANRRDTFICHAIYVGCACCSLFLQLTDGSSMQSLTICCCIYSCTSFIVSNMYKHLGTHWQIS